MCVVLRDSKSRNTLVEATSLQDAGDLSAFMSSQIGGLEILPMPCYQLHTDVDERTKFIKLMKLFVNQWRPFLSRSNEAML